MSGYTKDKIAVRNNAGTTTPAATAPRPTLTQTPHYQLACPAPLSLSPSWISYALAS
ncbi:hypothetical protein DY000_02022540 [Brassica cretica]|uniref:Uncharacterized protein n=1 Tax=Brassica cretica TaxID=69181 RepID=A0ABQ7EP14_BRACR|nr:hypothetical protein DY000_02022540 [Brassica cretica]